MSENQLAVLVQVLPPNPAWAQEFEAKAQALRAALGENCIAVHHIGSTSVADLEAKPIIDMIPVVLDILSLDSPKVLDSLRTLGYSSRGENGIPFRRFFQKGDSHVHAFQDSSPEVQHHLAFRDHLRASPGARQEYAELKRNLADQFPYDMNQYSLGKSKFIERIVDETGFSGIFIRSLTRSLLLNCTTETEWGAFSRILGRDISSEGGFSRVRDEVNYYFVLYQGSRIVAGAHLSLKAEDPDGAGGFEIKGLAIGPDAGGQADYEERFLELLALWAQHRGQALRV